MIRRGKPVGIKRSLLRLLIVNLFDAKTQSLAKHEGALQDAYRLNIAPILLDRMRRDFEQRIERAWTSCIVEIKRKADTKEVDDVLQKLQKSDGRV